MGKLKSQQLKSVRFDGKRAKLYDGEGLYLHVLAKGSVWRYDFQLNKKRKTLTIGPLEDYTLSRARDERRNATRLLRKGIDPCEAKRARRDEAVLEDANSLGHIAFEWLDQQSTWASTHKVKVRLRIVNYTIPALGDRPISKITSPELLHCLRKVEERGAVDSAHRLLNSLSSIFNYAIATGRCENNPTHALRGALKTASKKSYPHITDPVRLGEVLRAIDGYGGSIEVKTALQLAPLVFVRSGELRNAEWSEIDFERSLWTIPASRMKRSANGNHLVPLSKQALAVLTSLRDLTGQFELVFPGQRSKLRPISDNSLNAALRRLDISKDELVVHGFRHTASTMLNEMKGVDPDIIEVQLHHADQSMRGKYNKAKYFDARVQMMQEWSEYLDSLKSAK